MKEAIPDGERPANSRRDDQIGLVRSEFAGGSLSAKQLDEVAVQSSVVTSRAALPLKS